MNYDSFNEISICKFELYLTGENLYLQSLWKNVCLPPVRLSLHPQNKIQIVSKQHLAYTLEVKLNEVSLAVNSHISKYYSALTQLEISDASIDQHVSLPKLLGPEVWSLLLSSLGNSCWQPASLCDNLGTPSLSPSVYCIAQYCEKEREGERNFCFDFFAATCRQKQLKGILHSRG